MDRGLYLASILFIFMGLMGTWLGLYADISESFYELTGIALVILILGIAMLPLALYKGGRPPIESFIPIFALIVVGIFTIGWGYIIPQEETVPTTGVVERIYLLAGDYWFNETNPDIIVTRGSIVEVTIENVGEIVHSFRVVAVSQDSGYIYPGESITMSFVAGQPGVYDYICTIPGHVELGMFGKFIIQEGNQTTTTE